MIEFHDGQKRVLKSKSSRKIVVVGARWGKTTLAVMMSITKCLDNPAETVRIYSHNIRHCRNTVNDICECLDTRGIKYEAFNGEVYFPHNKSRILVDVFPYKGGTIIFDDAFDHVKDITIMFTPLGWMMHQASSLENPLADIPDDVKNTYSKGFVDSMFDAKFVQDIK